MLKKVFAGILIFTSISVLCGQDLNYQLNSINEKFNTNIQENTKNAITDFLEHNLFGMFSNWQRGVLWLTKI